MILNNTETLFLEEFVTKVLRKTIGIKHDVIIEDWDLDRVYITVNGEEHTIRTWNVWDGIKKNTLKVQWTLFKMIWDDDGSGHGEEIGFGTSIVNIND